MESHGRIHALRKRLRELPARLHDLFRDILTRDARDKDELILCIQCVLFAKRPLRPEELTVLCCSFWDRSRISEALGGGIYHPHHKSEVHPRFIKGLAETTKSEYPVVQFIHESVGDFLLKGNGLREVWPDLGERFQGQSHEQLKECCLKYTCADIARHLCLPGQLPKASTNNVDDLRDIIQQPLPFLEYAVCGVLHHANEAESEGIAKNGFLQSFPLQE